MIENELFISCDWGTTNFRSRLVNRHNFEIVKEISNNQGIKSLDTDFKKKEGNRFQFFSNVLLSLIDNAYPDLLDIPVICSGMLSSSIGMKELPYAEMPFSKTGDNLLSEKIKLDCKRDLILVSGVKSQLGFMRGEEIQAVGLAEDLSSEGVLILPGTHSKHLFFDSEAFLTLNNFMTGELFHLLTENSILGGSIESDEWHDDFRSSFEAGLNIGFNEQLSSNILTLRGRSMFLKTNPKDNYFFLSGLLIGDELAGLSSYDGDVFLACGASIFNQYKIGLETIFSIDKLTLFSDDQLKTALFKGQLKILENYGW